MAINMLVILNKIKGTDRGRSLGQTAINMLANGLQTKSTDRVLIVLPAATNT